jgi:transcriptional regulator of acetoin/glycerol metabolism
MDAAPPSPSRPAETAAAAAALNASAAAPTPTAPTPTAPTPTAPAAGAPPPVWSGDAARPQRSLGEMEFDAIRHAVDAAQGNISEASKRLGISRNTIYRKLRWNVAKP